MPERWLIRVDGIVQGVGFRPFVHRLASELGLVGHVGNDEAGVFIDAQGERRALTQLTDMIREHPPPLAVVERLSTESVPCDGAVQFTIAETRSAGSPTALVSPDMATCGDCLRELFDPNDRRYRYPFINCTNCGPRFTIVTKVPYDRPNTTMAAFTMCAACKQEYDDPADRRFHAQPVCCAQCGPRVRLLDSTGAELTNENPIAATAALLRGGGVIAVKGLGGFHLSVLADHEVAVSTLRRRKHREDKPFAVLCRDLDTAAALVEIDDAAAELLTGSARPVVLLPRRPDTAVAPEVAPGNRRLGVLLPYTPLHHLLAEAVARPLVLTSGNIADEPIAYRDDDAVQRLGTIADALLVHDRPIHIRTDDSVVQMRDRPLPIRRSRGYAPGPLTLPVAATRPVLGCGAHLKNVVALASGRRAFLSQHIGDLENAETLRSFVETVQHLERLFDVHPTVVAHDLHPDYLSTKWALDLLDSDLADAELIGVQHHHAHIAACLADNDLSEQVIGVAFDGLGYGLDSTMWGGEVLVADLTGFTRALHLEQVAMPGGVQAIREPWRMAAAWLDAAFADGPPAGLDVQARHPDRWDAVTAISRSGTAPVTSSVGRLFDTVAALCGIRDVANYEGQAAVELEQAADPTVRDGYPMAVDDGVMAGSDLIRAVLDDLARSTPVPTIAARFHAGLATAAADACRQVRETTGIGTVALSGGVFQNELFTGLLVDRLAAEEFRVLTHRQVPPNDGGISYGQVAVAAARQAAVL